ncbi:ScbR family autoregulator-binding transcription factor [Streptomyces sp. NPDC059122]|uniref:ScbR family autoregulator-binding transcription factor n=1 Tax=Streptomyces sp. NPDC059122 TaxID=3346732 RepID=UPI00367ABE02
MSSSNTPRDPAKVKWRRAVTRVDQAERAPQQERAIRTRRRILECAGTLFDRRGYAGTTVEDIAKEAAVTRGALYHHFRHKQDIAAAILEEQFAGMVIPPQRLHAQELVDAGYLLCYGLQIDPIQRGAARLTMEQGTDPIDRTRAMQLWVDFAVSILSEAQKNGEVRPGVDVKRAARTLVASFAGVQNMSQAFADRRDLDEYITDIWRYSLPGVVNDDVMGQLTFDPARGAQIAGDGMALAS